MVINGMDSALRFEVGRPYCINQLDSGYLRLVSRMAEAKAYSNHVSVDSHLLLLQSMKKKLSLVDFIARCNGVVDWDVKRLISEITDLIERLRNLRQKLPFQVS